MSTPRLFDQPIQLTTITGDTLDVATWRGQVLLIVNVASRCGYTPQYAGLETLYRTYRARGFSVLGFPCDQFGHQEPGTESEIQTFCSVTYDVTFPMFRKTDVNGPRTHPLFAFLKARQPGPLGVQRIMWNFTKFLVGRDGTVLARYGSRTEPLAVAPDIDTALV